MLINVTQSHIDNGCKQDGENCPIANAISEALDADCCVENTKITIYTGYAPTFIKTPLAVRIFIDIFDRGLPVQPFSFWLEV
jgi:hypothetical protein